MKGRRGDRNDTVTGMGSRRQSLRFILISHSGVQFFVSFRFWFRPPPLLTSSATSEACLSIRLALRRNPVSSVSAGSRTVERSADGSVEAQMVVRART